MCHVKKPRSTVFKNNAALRHNYPSERTMPGCPLRIARDVLSIPNIGENLCMNMQWHLLHQNSREKLSITMQPIANTKVSSHSHLLEALAAFTDTDTKEFITTTQYTLAIRPTGLWKTADVSLKTNASYLIKDLTQQTINIIMTTAISDTSICMYSSTLKYMG